MANPFIVIGGVAVGVITAAFALLQVPGWVAGAHDASAKNDLAIVGIALENAYTVTDTYPTDLGALGSGQYGVNFVLGTDDVMVAASGARWCATARSESGAYFAASNRAGDFGEGATADDAAADANCAAHLLPTLCPPAIDRTAGQVNRALNPSAEVSVNRWMGARSTVTRDTSRARYGEASFKVTVTQTDAQNYVIATNSVASRLPVTGGEQLPMVASVYLEEANPYMGLQMYEYDSNGDLLLPVLLSPLAPADAGRWTTLSHTFTLKPEAATVRPVIIGHQTMGLGAQWWLDGIAVGTDTYFDGDTLPGCFDPAVMRVRWAGAPHDSATILERR